jgi:ABC-type branched-subunit amino acid transport system ATPase component
VMGNDPAPAPRVRPTTLDVRGVTVRFGGTVALNNFSITVGPGEVVGLIGPNGAGKSTAIDAITGFVTPSAGSVSLDAQAIEGWTRERRARAGLSRSFQTLELFDDLTVLENIQAADDRRDLLGYLTALFRPGRETLGAPARAAVLDFGFERDLDRYVHELSYAQRRMLAVARSVAGGQPVLLLDEPASGLDDQQTRLLSETVRRLAVERGVAVLLIEHNVDMVLRTCDRVYALNFGEIIGAGTPAEIRANPAVIEAYLGAASESTEPPPHRHDEESDGRPDDRTAVMATNEPG